LFTFEDTTGELIIQTQQNGATFELVPHSKLLEDFPLFFSSDYHHWLDLEAGVLEFRPITAPWTAHDNNWRLRFSSSSSGMQQVAEERTTQLVDIHSRTFKSIARQLAPLESSRYLHITSAALGLSTELPRMELSFFVNRTMQLESHNLRGQVIDENQSTGTMFGLQNQLVLCAKDPITASLPQSRTVLIPHGVVSFSTRDNHARVAIDPGEGRHVVFYQYKVDSDLQYLSGNTNLTSRLFKIYLHALTSHCLLDPLTGQTGTEEALRELSESATSSFEQIDQEQAHLLQHIGALTPKREYYPAYLRSTQTTTWADLSPLSQHYAFCTAANSILHRASALELFRSADFDLKSHLTEFNHTLLERATRRTCMYYTAGTFASLTAAVGDSSTNDPHYEGRACLPSGWTDEGHLASWASGLVHRRWGQPTYVSVGLVTLAESWNHVNGPANSLKLAYNSEWFALDLPSSWISLYNLCRKSAVGSSQFKLSSSLATAIYGGWLPERLVPVLVAFATNPTFRHLDPPSHSSYQLSDGYKPTEQRIGRYISAAIRDTSDTPSSNIAGDNNKSAFRWAKWRKTYNHTQISRLKTQLTQNWVDCWPNTPSAHGSAYSGWIRIEDCLEQVQFYFQSCSRNVDLRTHLEAVETALASHTTSDGLGYEWYPPVSPKAQQDSLLTTRNLDVLSIERLMERRNVPDSGDILPQPDLSVRSESGAPPDTARLSKLLAEFHTSTTYTMHRRYGADLEASRADLAKVNAVILPNQLPSYEELDKNRIRQRDRLGLTRGTLKSALGPSTDVESVASTAGIWPHLTPRAILGQLALCSRAATPTAWHSTLLGYAQTFMEFQRSQRLIVLARENKHEEFYKELDIASAESGTGIDRADWLLVQVSTTHEALRGQVSKSRICQIDGNFSVRTVQSKVAREMISPSSAASTVLQLNMGEGKSSVIVPIIAATLADSSKLVRVVVLKPLWRQMFQLLVSRLSGLVNRRIYYLPFSRQIQVGSAQAKQIQDLYTECMREGGILLVQPEHILSFKMMGIDQLTKASTPQHTTAVQNLRGMQDWLSKNARDIFDESDEILHVRYQLVYTVGKQQPLEENPDRWIIIQHIFPLVAKHIERLKQNYPEKLKHEDRSGGQFPFIRIMPESDEVIAQLVHSVAKDALGGQLPNLNLSLLPSGLGDTALRLLTEKAFPQMNFELLANLDRSMRKGLLLLRGLLACGILAFTLKDKNYRVNYGLHLSRTLVAVPYHAKV
jgi:hypothetical protein